ncbi:MAG: M23 family metallopeptidase [Armatimonadota bacterium]
MEVSSPSVPATEAPKASRSSTRVSRVLRGLGAVLLLLAGLATHYEGLLLTVLFQGAALLIPAGVVVRLWSAWRRQLEYGLFLRPLAPETRPYLLQALLRSGWWLLVGATLCLSFPAALLAPEEYPVVLVLFWVLAGVLALLEWLPRRRIYRTANALFLIGALFLGWQWVRVHLPPPEPRVVLDPPFRGTWNVFHGGRSALINHHYLIPAQEHALDLERSLNGPPSEPQKLEAYAAWDQPLHAPADGLVVSAVNHLRDNPIGETDLKNLAGNQVVLQIGEGRFVLLAHLKQGSVRVKPGQRVRRGELLARCGNSGNTSEPHLHLQVQNRPDFQDEELRTFPILFRNVTLTRRGRSRHVAEADVRRNDRLTVPEGRQPTD